MTASNTPFEHIPEQLKDIPHWITWSLLSEKKVPNIKINEPEAWLTFEEASKRKPINKDGGIGFVFDDTNSIGGIDLDACRNPDTGELTEWAQKIIKAFNSYTEVSPSGTGVKIFADGAPPKISPNVLTMPGELINGKQPQIEVYTTGRYFAVTGVPLEGAPNTLRNNPKAWLNMVQFLGMNAKATTDSETAKHTSKTTGAGSRNNTLASLAGAMRKRNMDYDSILAAIRVENKAKFDPPLSEKELQQIVKSVCRYKPDEEGFNKTHNGKILENDQVNVRLALDKLEIKLSYNVFADRMLVNQRGRLETSVDDTELNRIWLEIDETFHFRPSTDFLKRFIPHECMKNTFHPVKDYLDSLQWDGKPRIDKWLNTYAKAADNEYTQAVSRLVMLAAVRRIRKPGCKFDEMLVLESSQGKNKSTFLNTLVPDEAWFIDDLPLAADSKVVVEKTSGRWIIEAAELSGMRKSDIETLKSFLSRRVEVARMSYAHFPVERPRHFIVIGTTNAQYYLKDTTGNRRFWPVRVMDFDIEALKHDRDQLWAEASAREAKGESIRLDPGLYELAGMQQERRRIDDPWEHAIEGALGNLNGKVLTEDIWQLVGVPLERRNQNDNARIGEVMRRMGFDRRQARQGKDKVFWTYQRGTKEERHNWIRKDFDTEENSLTFVLSKDGVLPKTANEETTEETAGL